MRHALLLSALLSVLPLAAQPVTVGAQTSTYFGGAVITSGAPATYVNLTDYAATAGVVDHASVTWTSSAPCNNAFKVIFLRAGFHSASAFTVVATRGPFKAVNGINYVTLDPPVTLAVGDLIGVVTLQPSSACGTVRTQNWPTAGYNLITAVDLSATNGVVGNSSNYGPGYRIGAMAYAGERVLVKILPAAGSLQGAGTFFRTSLQLLNTTDYPIQARLVYHPQGQSASASDVFINTLLPVGRVLSVDDIVFALGQSGLGSLDVYTDGGALPIVTARVFSDAGAAGTSGFSEEGVSPQDAFDVFSAVTLPLPKDLTNFRMNIGIRTLDAGATFNIVTYDVSGKLVGDRSGVQFPPNYFVQRSLADFTGVTNLDLLKSGFIRVSLTNPSDRAFVYGSVIDNRTSDSSFRMATPY
ncbi:MAG: hypothetical protein M3Q69_00870 [Acidobacteriota bacterium]|nr:hypothetical protein [Acidobacteriota bacterium]